ncbi:hypothetical protein V2A85_21870, partial [Yersinia sp. 1252 StPb PI]
MILKNNLYPSYFKLHVRWLLSLLGPSIGLVSTRPLQAAFKSAPGRFVTRIIDWRQLIGIYSIAAFLQLELFRLY